MPTTNIFNINNALGINTKYMNKPIVYKNNSIYSNILESISEDMEIIADISTDFYRGIDKGNKDITVVAEEFHKFYNNVDFKLREMCKSIINDAKECTNNVNNIISRSSNNIQKYLDHLYTKPEDYTYSTNTFRYTFNDEIPVLSDIVEIGKDVNVNKGTNILERFNNHETRISNPNYMNIVRGSVAASYGTEIESDQFYDFLYRMYRNGDDKTQSVIFRRQDLIDICSTLLSYLDASQSILDDAKEIEDKTIIVLDTISELNRSEFVKDLDDDDIYIYYSYLYNKLVELVEVFTIVRLAYGVKLEAYSESYLNRLDIVRNHYNTGGIVVEPNNLLESINHIFFISDMETNNANIIRAISEQNALSINEVSTATYELRLVNENFSSDIKDVLGRLMNRIKNLWDKFREKVISLTRSDKTYLNKYKNIILNRPMVESTFEMYDFPNGVRVMMNATVPRFNFQLLRDSLETEEKFIDTHFQRYKKKGLSFTDGCKLIFRGSDAKKNFRSSNLNVKEMYEFCMNYDKMIDVIKRDMKNIEDAANEAINIIDAINVNTESVVYSSLRRSVLYEDDANTNPTVTIKKDSKEKDRLADGASRASNDDSKSNDIQRIMNYMRVTQNFLGCKMTVLQEVYKGYMYIIREHVKSHIGTRNTSKPEQKNNTNMRNIDDNTDGIKKNFLS